MSQTNILLEAGTNELEIVEFFIEEGAALDEKGNPYCGYYGVNVAKVLEIIRMPKITELPEVKNQAVMGAFNLRDNIIPLVDLGLWLGKGCGDMERQQKAIVTEFSKVVTAFMVSGVNRIHRISWEQVEQPSKYVGAMSKDLITGVVKIDNRIIFLLDLERIVSDLNPTIGFNTNSDFSVGYENNYRIIIADDSALIREMLKDLLQKANFNVEVTHNGKEAWDRLCEMKAKAALEGKKVTEFVQGVVSDIEMPSMDGHNLCKRIKDDSELHNLPVVLFSSLITEKLRHKGEAVGADDQISKPDANKLAKKMYELISERLEKNMF